MPLASIGVQKNTTGRRMKHQYSVDVFSCRLGLLNRFNKREEFSLIFQWLDVSSHLRKAYARFNWRHAEKYSYFTKKNISYRSWINLVNLVEVKKKKKPLAIQTKTASSNISRAAGTFPDGFMWLYVVHIASHYIRSGQSPGIYSKREYSRIAITIRVELCCV